MGYYIETDSNTRKADYLVKHHHGIRVTQQDAVELADDSDFAVIIIIHNSGFEAAGYAYNQDEFERFNDPTDRRTKEFVVIERKLADQLTNR